MISILIHVYNTKLYALVHTLSEKLKTSGEGEIIVLDDCSLQEFRETNEEVNGLPGVRYKFLDRNIGRLQIRKELAMMSNYPWLLFIDGDSEIKNKEFLKCYLDKLQM